MVDVKICKNCAFFVKALDPKSKYSYENENKCISPKFVYVTYNGETPIDGLGYWDAECWKAGFYVGENFGCIHFNKRS